VKGAKGLSHQGTFQILVQKWAGLNYFKGLWKKLFKGRKERFFNHLGPNLTFFHQGKEGLSGGNSKGLFPVQRLARAGLGGIKGRALGQFHPEGQKFSHLLQIGQGPYFLYRKGSRILFGKRNWKNLQAIRERYLV